MAGYGWTAYHIRDRGTKTVNDTRSKIDLITEFVKVSNDGRHGDWAWGVKGVPKADAMENQKTTVIFYPDNQDPDVKNKMHGRTSGKPF